MHKLTLADAVRKAALISEESRMIGRALSLDDPEYERKTRELTDKIARETGCEPLGGTVDHND